MKIYKTRYEANKDRQGLDIIVKVCGGYTIMEPSNYKTWRQQR